MDGQNTTSVICRAHTEFTVADSVQVNGLQSWGHKDHFEDFASNIGLLCVRLFKSCKEVNHRFPQAPLATWSLKSAPLLHVTPTPYPRPHPLSILLHSIIGELMWVSKNPALVWVRIPDPECGPQAHVCSNTGRPNFFSALFSLQETAP